MKWLYNNGVLLVLGLATAGGVAAAGAGVYRALAAVQALVSVGVRGTAAQMEVQQGMEESQRNMRNALVETDQVQRNRGISEVRSADLKVARGAQALADLDLPESARRDLGVFHKDWDSYREARDRSISLLHADAMGQAQAVARRDAGPAFRAALDSTQALRRGLDRMTAEHQETVRVVLYQALAEMAVLAVATVLFVASLLWSYRRHRDFAYVRQRNEELALAEQLEHERARILEMTGRSESLHATLAVLVSMVQKQLPGSLACVSVIQESNLREVVALNLPKSFLEHVHRRRVSLEQGTAPLEEEEARAHGLEGCWSVSVTSSTGQRVGSVDVYLPKASAPTAAQNSILESSAKLAGIVIQHRQLYEQLAFQAQRDPLTELPNRRVFQDRLEQAILRANRDQQRVAVLLIDLDRFKQVNDLLGHRVGDALLRAVAQRILGCLRKSDTLARIGGDEFTILLNPVEGQSGAELTLQRVLQSLRKPLTILDHEVSISASIGLAMYPDHGEDSATLVRNADLAMYHAKGRGKNGWQVYVPELGALMLRRMTIEKSLENAIENGELEMHYQVQTGLDRRVTGVEALIRWHSPVLGTISPEIFVPVAEESGLIVPVGAWVMEQACRQGAAWIAAGYPIGRMAVNISARQLSQSDFIDDVRRTLKSTGLRAEQLELELTETALMHNIEDCLERLSALRELGVTVAIDDFGTGYSSLGYLQKLPVNRVKIDRSFISGITSKTQETLPLIRAIVDLAHGLGLEVIAEGVETESQLEVLRTAGCDAAQGYLLHRPGPARDIAQFLQGQGLGLTRLKAALEESGELLPAPAGEPAG